MVCENKNKSVIINLSREGKCSCLGANIYYRYYDRGNFFILKLKLIILAIKAYPLSIRVNSYIIITAFGRM